MRHYRELLPRVQRWIVCVLPLAAIAAGDVVRADARPSREDAGITETLDDSIEKRIEITQKPVREAFSQLEKRTNLKFQIDSSTVDLMPYGERTRISIVLENVRLRDGLRRVFDGLGLGMRVANDAVVVEPLPVLRRVGRRLTLEEVGVLQALAAKRWSDLDRKKLSLTLVFDPAAPALQKLEEAMRQAHEPSALHELECATNSLGWTWYPRGGSIVISSREADARERLDRTLNVDYRGVSLEALMADLAQRIGVSLEIEPGALRAIGAAERKVDLVQKNTTAREALDRVCGSTGLRYEISPRGLKLLRPQESQLAGATTPGPRLVAILRIPIDDDGTTIDFLLREDELPEEFRQFREMRLPKIIEVLRDELAKEKSDRKAGDAKNGKFAMDDH